MANSTKISEYSTTAANNTSIDSIDIDENCAASGINNAIRSVLKHQADAFTQGTPIALDQTNNRVGIGITSPAKSLSINTSSNTDGIDIGGGGTVYTSITSAGTDTTIQATNAFAINTNGANERLRIDSSGNVGIGSSPAAKLHVQTSAVNSSIDNVADEFVIENNGACGMTILSANNDSGFILFGDDSDNAAAGIRYEHANSAMSFRVNSAWDRMRIGSNGSIVHGGTTQIENCFYNQHFAPATFAGIGMKPTTNSGYDAMRFNNNGGSRIGTIACTTTSTAYNTSSDHRLKEAVVDMTGAIDRVKSLAPKRFNFIADDSVTVDGFLAHEAQTVVPEAVTGTHNEVDDDGNAVMQGIDQSKLVPLLTGALKEAITKIETLETEMTALKARVTALEA